VFRKNKMPKGRSHIIPKQKLNLDVTHIANAPGVDKSPTSLPHAHPNGEHTLVSKSTQTDLLTIQTSVIIILIIQKKKTKIFYDVCKKLY